MKVKDITIIILLVMIVILVWGFFCLKNQINHEQRVSDSLRQKIVDAYYDKSRISSDLSECQNKLNPVKHFVCTGKDTTNGLNMTDCVPYSPFS